MAEGILKKIISDRGLRWTIESFGVEKYHVGENADGRAERICARNGIDISQHIARRFSREDFQRFDIIYPMATDVYDELRRISRASSDLSKVKLFMDELYPNKHLSVPDPWYGNEEGFTEVFDLIEKGCGIIADRLSQTVKTA
jgi:protein-tyrosine phosphatase